MSAKIVHVISGLMVGGAEMMLYKLLRAMGSGRFEHEVVALSGGPAPVASMIEALGIPVHKCGMHAGLPNPAEAMRVSRLIRRLRPDLLHGWMYHGNLAVLIASVLPGRTPVIWNICDGRARHEKPTTALVDWLGARVSRWPDRIISDSNAGARVHRDRGYFPKRWEVIPNGFDTEQFRPSAKARGEVRAELSLPKDALLVGLMGNYSAIKDHTGFLGAAALLLRQAPDAHFLLAGRGVAGQPALLDRLASLDLGARVHLMGERADMARIAASLDIAVSSSWSESLPSVVGEAMASGVPCVVTDVGDSAWLVGDTGLVVPPRNPAALAGACAGLISRGAEWRRTMGLAARQRIVREFSMAAYAGRYEKVYRQSLGEELVEIERLPDLPGASKSGRTSGVRNPTIIQVLTRLGGGGLRSSR